MSTPQQPNSMVYSQGFGASNLNPQTAHLDIRAPSTADVQYPISKKWINTLANTAYVLTSFSASAGVTTANWQEITNAGGGGAGAFTTLTSSGATTLATTGASVNTFGNATGATSVTITSGTGGVTLESTGTGDIIINSDDTLLLDADGVLELNSSAGAISIGNDADAQAINIGTAGARTITVGNVTALTALNLIVGTGNFSLDGVGASTYTIGASTTTGTTSIGGTAQTGTITLGSSSGVNIVAIGAGEGATTVNIAGGATAAKAVNIATGAVASTVAIGSASAGAITVDTAAGISLDAATASNFTVTGAGIDLTLASVGGSVAVSSNEAVATAIGLTASDAAGGITLTAGTGNINLTATNVVQSKSLAGTALTNQVTNSDNTSGTSNARVEIATGGASSGDPALSFQISGVAASTMTMGLDNSASDLFVISNSSDIGTSNALTLSQAGALTATTSITATLGNITATNGNLVLGTAGNKISITTGANASLGQDTLAGGTVTVNTTAVTASSRIFLSRASIGATGAAATGNLVVGTVVAGTSFVINAVQAADATALQASDVSVINWWIVN